MPNAPPKLRLATYNVEWFNALFDDQDRLIEDDTPSARHKISRAAQIAALGRVFSALDADGVMVIEAPDTGRTRATTRALEAFAQRFNLRTNRAITGYPSETEQEIAFLYDPTRITPRHDPQGDPHTVPRFDMAFSHDLNLDARPEKIRFSKPPLELVLDYAGGTLRLIGVHAKSKAPHGARGAESLARLGIENRRKQLAQCLWIRARVDQVLDEGADLIVLGDFNDGPGLDEYEALFGRSGVEIVLGSDLEAHRQLTDPHARLALSRRVGLTPATARFWNHAQRRYFGALLDFVMVSPKLAATGPAWRIWHPMDDPDCWKDQPLRDALLTASDHFPVAIDLFGDGTGHKRP